MSEKICYCFDYTETDIIADARNNQGHSLILEQILTAKKQGSCRCAETHPEGR